MLKDKVPGIVIDSFFKNIYYANYNGAGNSLLLAINHPSGNLNWAKTGSSSIYPIYSI